MKTFMKTTPLVLLSALLGACAGGYVTNAMAPVKTVDGTLTGTNGMTLYTFDRDVAGGGKSMCNGPCATNWPPLLVTDKETTGSDYSIVLRDDGKRQWAYKGKPLYYWSQDQKPGDKKGEGFNNVWRAATP